MSALRRVVVEHAPNLYAILGLYSDEETAEQTLVLKQGEKEIPRTYYRAKSSPRWVLYRAAVTGHGEQTFDPAQR